MLVFWAEKAHWNWQNDDNREVSESKCSTQAPTTTTDRNHWSSRLSWQRGRLSSDFSSDGSKSSVPGLRGLQVREIQQPADVRYLYQRSHLLQENNFNTHNPLPPAPSIPPSLACDMHSHTHKHTPKVYWQHLIIHSPGVK